MITELDRKGRPKAEPLDPITVATWIGWLLLALGILGATYRVMDGTWTWRHGVFLLIDMPLVVGLLLALHLGRNKKTALLP